MVPSYRTRTSCGSAAAVWTVNVCVDTLFISLFIASVPVCVSTGCEAVFHTPKVDCSKYAVLVKVPALTLSAAYCKRCVKVNVCFRVFHWQWVCTVVDHDVNILRYPDNFFFYSVHNPPRQCFLCSSGDNVGILHFWNTHHNWRHTQIIKLYCIVAPKGSNRHC